ncbi:hypothetical protein JCM18694_11390 [Prolixibacter denitrificans]|uniref:Uncharacterized protein n=1 Tax=Prolixibacter denitrificans TaxID=1541063 RepID=A0ABQ0ZHS7_9BACT|nr:hypothetical protein JCM18694_11390 [Prolixibacter denitrificans]
MLESKVEKTFSHLPNDYSKKTNIVIIKKTGDYIAFGVCLIAQKTGSLTYVRILKVDFWPYE